MAAGLNTYNATINGSGSNVLYTCPAGVSKQTAQVRVNMRRQCSAGAVGSTVFKINGNAYWSLDNTSANTDYSMFQTFSVILVPGDSFTVDATGSGASAVTTCSLFISGYTEP